MASYTYRLPRRYRYRGHRKASGQDKAAIAIVVVVLAAGMAGGKAAASPHHHGGTAAACLPVIGSGAGLAPGPGGPRPARRGQPAADVLQRVRGAGVGGPRGRRVRQPGALQPPERQPRPGRGLAGYPAIGAWAFPDAVTGLRYTVRTLNNGYYGGILAGCAGELRAGSVQRDHGQPVGGQPLRRHPDGKLGRRNRCSGNADSGQPGRSEGRDRCPTGAGAAGRS